ncbi:MAG: Hpt domain-containing protein, partial [Planctomycetota bacterium]|nr:Hpt domain-containing protein [Planctomycetota bacterium]
MLNKSLLDKLRQIALSLDRLGVSSSDGEWHGLADAADGLIGDFLQAGDSDAHDLLQLLRDVANSLAKGMIADPAEGVKTIHSIVDVLNGLGTPAGMSESLRKQALAEGKLFFRDVEREESRVDEESAFEGDEERREMIMSIESRIDELDGDLLNLNPPVADSEQVRAIFRQFHTLKGEGAICGIKSVAEFCHGIETEIEDARNGNLIITSEIVAILQELSGILRPILAGKSREEIGEEMIQSLMDELRLTVSEAKEMAARGNVSSGPAVAAGGNGGDGSGDGATADPFADFFSGFAPPPEKLPDGVSAAGEAGMAPEFSDAVGRREAADLSENLGAEDFLAALGNIVKPDNPDERPEAGKTGSHGKSPADTIIESGELLGAAGDTAALKKEVVEKKGRGKQGQGHLGRCRAPGRSS